MRALRGNMQGYSLAETMVGMLIGLLGVLMIMQVATLFQERRHSAVAASQAAGHGALAAHAMERDLRSAGYGLGAATGCRLHRFFLNKALAPMSLTPLEITADLAGPDVVLIRFGTRPAAVDAVPITQAHTAATTVLELASTAGMAADDQVILFEPGRDCMLAEISTTPSGTAIRHEAGTHKWNSGGGGASGNSATPGSGSALGDYTTAGSVIDIGQLGMVEYMVRGGVLQRRVYRPASNDWQAQELATGIVLLKAQYGFDTRPGTSAARQVTSWRDSMVDADGDGTLGSAGDVLRMLAVRMVLLAQVGAREKPGADGCQTTTVKPQWHAGAADGNVTLADLPVGQIGDWKCYRYQVFENVIPFRNLLWR
ncbi:PilW family protein [Lacisediminimonas profundi]|uniref:PilW family protein n=1 Tax=Lacisediminimonas profundi TaxID=2603856 RepID=UPI00124AF9C5|nr:PilW family protein [Lacisediminimonas profundi]